MYNCVNYVHLIDEQIVLALYNEAPQCNVDITMQTIRSNYKNHDQKHLVYYNFYINNSFRCDEVDRIF